METTHTQEDHIVLEAHCENDGIIYTKVSGRITNDRLYAFVAWTEKVKQLIREQLAKNSDSVLVLSDVGGVTYFERKPIVPLKELLDYDKRYPIKSAIVGADKLTRMLLDAVISLSGRTNIQMFQSANEARAWLLTPVSPPKEKENIGA